jgi:hypothetical protein
LVPSTVKVTLPAGTVFPEEAATVAVNVTLAPTVAGLALDATVVVVPVSAAAVIVSVKLLLVLVANVEVPP